MKKMMKKKGLTFPYPSLQTVSHIPAQPQPHSVVTLGLLSRTGGRTKELTWNHFPKVSERAAEPCVADKASMLKLIENNRIFDRTSWIHEFCSTVEANTFVFFLPSQFIAVTLTHASNTIEMC